jgi:Skp family chaperone for outer membrane proteins
MKREFETVRALIAACFISAGASAIAAEPLPIALVNVDRILKSYRPLQEKLDPIKAEAKELDGTVQIRQAEIETVGGHLRSAQPGSPEQQRLQRQFVKLQSDLQQFITTERQKLNSKEVTIYVGLFRQLDAEISKYAKAHGLKLVIRQHESSYDEGQPLPEILKALNRGILYEENLDITDDILKALEKSAPHAGNER